MTETDTRVGVLVLVTTLSVGGCEKMVYELARGLDRSRFRVVVASLKGDGLYADRLREEGIAVLECHMAGFWDARALGALLRCIHEYRISIVHSFLFHANMFGRLLKCFQPSLKIISSIRTMEKDAQWHLTVDMLTKWLVDNEIANAEAVRDFTIVKTGSSPGRIVTVYNGVETPEMISDMDRLQLRSSFGFFPHDVIVGTVGSLEKAKDHAFFIDVVRELLKNGNKAMQFVIIGEGSLRPDLECRVQQYGLSERVRFFGQKPDAVKLMAMFDLFFLSSAWEGFPNVVLEAFSRHIPVVSRRVGGIEEIVPEWNELFVCDGDAAACAERIKKVLENNDIIKTYVNDAARAVQDRFSLARMVRETQHVYDTAVINS